MTTLHSKVIGDIDTSVKRVQTKNLGNEIGSMALREIVSTSTCIPFSHNRPTSVEWATKCLNQAGGFDWKLFGSIEGIKQADGTIEIWDGLGRLCMAQLAGIDKIPVTIHLDGSPGALFVKKQKTTNRALNQEQFFVAAASSIFAGFSIDARTDNTIRRDVLALQMLGMRIENGQEYYPTVTDIKDYPSVKVNALRRCMALTQMDTEVIKKARDLIVQAYPNTDYIGKELLEGLTFLFMAIPAAQKNGTYKALGKFLKTMAVISQDKLPFKKIGGNVHNDEARSVALGIVDMFKTSDFSKGNPGNILIKKAITDYRRIVIEDDTEE